MPFLALLLSPSHPFSSTLSLPSPYYPLSPTLSLLPPLYYPLSYPLSPTPSLLPSLLPPLYYPLSYPLSPTLSLLPSPSLISSYHYYIPVHFHLVSCNERLEEKTAIPLEEDNIGHKMLLNMGWVPWQGLGLQENGIINPIPVDVKRGKTGLGISTNHTHRGHTTE